MKTSLVKLKSKAYLMGNTFMLCLLFFTLLFLWLCLNMLPEIAVQTINFSKKDTVLIGVSIGVIALTFILFAFSDMGFTRYFLRKAQRSGGSVKDLFFYLAPKKAVKLLGFSIKLASMKTLLFLLCFLPFSVNVLIFLSLAENSLSLKVSVVMLVSALLFFLSGCIFYSEITDSLFLVKYYYAKGEYLNFRQLVSSSQLQMKKHRASLIKLKLSFSLWLIFSLFFFPSAYVFSYYSQSKAVAASEFMSD